MKGVQQVSIASYFRESVDRMICYLHMKVSLSSESGTSSEKSTSMARGPGPKVLSTAALSLIQHISTHHRRHCTNTLSISTSYRAGLPLKGHLWFKLSCSCNLRTFLAPLGLIIKSMVKNLGGDGGVSAEISPVCQDLIKHTASLD